MDGDIKTSALQEAPARLDTVNFGLYRGAVYDGPPVPKIPLAALRHKRWVYVGVYDPGAVFGLAVANLGFASNAFAYVGTIGNRASCEEWKAVAPPWCASPGRRSARWRGFGGEWDITLPEGSRAGRIEGHCRLRDGSRAEVSLELRPHRAADVTPTVVTCVAPSDAATASRWNLTLKDNTLSAVGTLRWGETVRELNAPAILDVTDAYPRRHTEWHWASAAGRDPAGRALGLNLCAKHNDSERARENVVWLEGVPRPLGAVKFEFDPTNPTGSPWTLRGERVNLRFDPSGGRRGDENLGVVVSRFVQPYGLFTGEVGYGDETLRFDGVAGVVEDHVAVW
jgi:hypothetical protein